MRIARSGLVAVWLVSAGCVGAWNPGGGMDGGPGNPAGNGSGSGNGNGNGNAGSDGGAGGPDLGGPTDPCATKQCALHAHCDAAQAAACVCDDGFILMGGTCAATPVGNPATRTQSDVCTRWTASGQSTSGVFSKSTTTCDPGTLSQTGMDDAMRRLNFYRWFVGLAPTGPVAASNTNAQACALVSAWNPVGPQAHNPPTTSTCYTAAGATGAGSSNIAWGARGPVDSMDIWIQDDGNATTLGHRRWILNPPLDPVGYGYYEGGNNYGSAACLVVFSSAGTGPRPDSIPYPAPGFAPLETTLGTWSFSADGWSFAGAQVTVTRLSDNAALPVTIQDVSDGYGNYPPATSWKPNGWMPQAGQTYRVTVSAGGKTATYDVKPVSC